MAARGRKSAASLEVVPLAPVQSIPRAEAPAELTDEQAAEWMAIVNRLPAEWFPRETHGLLADYCRHVVRSRRIAQMVDQAESEEPLDLDQLDKLYRMAERESRAASSLATRLRITQQSTVNHKTKKPTQLKRPWES